MRHSEVRERGKDTQFHIPRVIYNWNLRLSIPQKKTHPRGPRQGSNAASTPPQAHLTLVQSVRLSHGALDVKAPNILPVLLEEGDQEVDSHLHIDEKLLLAEGHIADGNAQAQHLLQLEFDASLDLVHLPRPPSWQFICQDIGFLGQDISPNI